MMKRKPLKFKIQIAFISLIILLLSGCQITNGLKAVMSKKVKPQYFTYQDKSIIFAPLVHFGQKEFYSSLKDSIVDWKEDGYTIFYEYVKGGSEYLGIDSVSFDRLRRKFRRVSKDEVRPIADYEEDLQKVFKKGVVQPDYGELGLDSTDFLPDITFLDLVNKIEEVYGEIQLDSCDLATPFDSTYTCSKGMKMKELKPIILDYRNSEVVKKIINSDLNKIVVLFGAAHIKGMKKLLKDEETTRTNAPK